MKESMHGHPLECADAHLLLSDFTSVERHEFLPSPALSSQFVGQTSGHKAAFDDYLVQIAAPAGYTLATFDRALTNRWPMYVKLISQPVDLRGLENFDVGIIRRKCSA